MTRQRRRLVELSHLIEPGMTTVPGLPGPRATPYLTRESSRAHYAPGTEFAIDEVTLLGNTGTYLDTPFHRYPHGHDLGDLPLEKVADVPAVVIRATELEGRAVDLDAVAAYDVAGKRSCSTPAAIASSGRPPTPMMLRS